MSSLTKQPLRIRPLVWGLAGALFCASTGWSADPAFTPSYEVTRQRGPVSQIGSATAVQDARPVKLNHLSASWESVLLKLAEQTGSQLIAKQYPSARFSRRDANHYSREEAVRVLNRELEKDGFRLLEQEEYLILLRLEEARTKYARPSYSRETGRQLPPETIMPIEDRNANSRRFSEIAVASHQTEASTPATSPYVQQTAHALEQTAPPQRPQPNVRVVVAPKSSSIEIARFLHQSFGTRSELLDAGPGGFPAFRISRSGESETSPVGFAVGIDTLENKLLIEAPESAANEIKATIELLDHAIEAKVPAFRIIPSDRDVKMLATTLQPSMDRLLAANNQPDNIIGNPAAPVEQTLPGETGNPLSPNLRSDVSIYAVPELGAIVVTGSEKDVAAVMAVIREIEKLSVGTTPAIQLFILKHVDSTQLSTLLETVYTDLIGRRSTTTTTPGQTATQAANQRGRATFVPVAKPNSLLIIAPETEMESILDLAEQLDQPVDPQTEFEVFFLKSAVSSQVETLLNEFFADRTGLGGAINAFADVRTNSVIVRARPRDLEEAATLIRKIDRDASGAVNQMKVLPLKNAVATEIADVLNEALRVLMLPAGQSNTQGAGTQNITATGDSSQALRDIKSIAVEFLSTQGDGKQLIRSGILADVRITADPRINSLIVTAPEASMTLLEALIRYLDQVPSSVAEIKVFTLKNSDATLAATLLSELFAQTQTGNNQTGQQTSQGVQIVGATDISNSLIPMKFSVDIRTNSVVAIGGADALNVVEAILLRLDEDEIRQRKTTVIKLQNSPADAVAQTIDNFLTRQQELAAIQPELISNIEFLEREVVVEAELNTNSLLVSATPKYYSQILEMIQRLDAAPPQVIIQALLVEVQLENTDEFGIELGLQDSILFSRGLTNPGFLFNTPTLGNNTSGPGTDVVGGQTLSNFGMGRNNSDLGFGGLVLSASSENISVLIRALAARRNLQVLSRPQIRTLDNVQAQIQVGQQVPVVNGVTVSAQGQSNPNVSQQDTGIILTVRPRINPDGTIVLETTAEKSQLSDLGVPIFVDTSGTVIESPIIDKTGAQATVSVPNGHTIVMGGMISKSDSTIERKVPWLGDVPLLGRAFRYDSSTTRRSELLIFLTPRVILNDADSEFIKQVESERMHYIESDAEELHGPLFSVPPENFDPATINNFNGKYFEQTPDGMSYQTPGSPLMPVPTPAEPVEGTIQQMSYTAPTTYHRPAAVNVRASAEPAKKKRLWPFK